MATRVVVRRTVSNPNSTKTITRKVQYRINKDGSVSAVVSKKTTPKV